MTYDTNFDFTPLFEKHNLAASVNHVGRLTVFPMAPLLSRRQNIAFHAGRCTENRAEDDHKVSQQQLEPPDHRALTESLKLLFNLTQFYPAHTSDFTDTIPSILRILQNITLAQPVLQSPVTNLINALINLDLPGKEIFNGNKRETPLFPTHSPFKHTGRLISILELGIGSEDNADQLEIQATPLVSVLRRINDIAPSEVRGTMQEKLLPSSEDRSKPLGKSDTLPSRLLRLSTSASGPNLREATSSLLFELSDKDPMTFIRNVGYGYAAGFLMSHKISIPDRAFEAGNIEATSVDGQEINPITGQRRDMEPVDDGPEMTDEEKEREAERLFVLFERLKATGVVNVMNPVEQAQRGGRIEEME